MTHHEGSEHEHPEASRAERLWAGEGKTERSKRQKPQVSRRLAIAATAGGVVVGGAAVAGVGYALRDEFVRWALQGGDAYTQLAWDRRTVDAAKQPPWQKFKGDPEITSDNPSEFKKLGLVAVNAEPVDKARRDLGAHHATAWRVDKDTIDVGTMYTGQSFFSSPKGNGGLYVIGQRIGEGDLWFTPGLEHPERGFFVPEGADPRIIGTVAITDLQAQHPGVIYV